MGDHAASAQLVELQPLEKGRSLNDAINGALLEQENLCLNADMLGVEVLDDLELRPECVAMRRLIQENLTHLDYDKLEAMLASPWFDKELI